MTPIDVIVPVYRGVEATRRCIESVLSTALSMKQQTPFELIAVNDACPEPELVRWLRELAERSRLTLLEQPLRQGFAAAVNRANALHPERDVVILHSDAEVANDWLDRLVAPASAARDIGTVVPFTNYGGIAGYPWTDVRNAMPAEYTLGSLDLLFRRANANSSVTTPLACGPCVFMRRACLDAVGPPMSMSGTGVKPHSEPPMRRTSRLARRERWASSIRITRRSARSLLRAIRRGAFSVGWISCDWRSLRGSFCFSSPTDGAGAFVGTWTTWPTW